MLYEDILAVMQKYWNNKIDQEGLERHCRGKISDDDFLKVLERTYNDKDSKSTEAIFHLGFSLNLFSEKTIPILSKFLSQVWHSHHEDIARIFQGLKSSKALQGLMEGIHVYKDHWYDNGDAFIRKCIYAIYSIETEEAYEKIYILSNDRDKLISKHANYIIKKYNL